METIEQAFSDSEGNHLLVALYFCDNDYKQNALQIPEQYADVEIVDINIEKALLDKPIHPSAFFKMSSWLLKLFEEHEDTIFTFICSIDDIDSNHPDDSPQVYRWNLFNRLYQRMAGKVKINIQDVIVGPEGFQSFGRAFYHDKHAAIIHIVAAHLQEK